MSAVATFPKKVNFAQDTKRTPVDLYRQCQSQHDQT